MKCKKINAVVVWKQLEDVLAPGLRLSVVDRVVYSHLLRHSRLEGKEQLRFSILWLARGIQITGDPARRAVRRLVSSGVLRLLERSKKGHTVEVRLPGEIAELRRLVPAKKEASEPDIEEANFLQTDALRESLHTRDGGSCFYCLRRLNKRIRALDHVVPLSRSGKNSYRNLVSSCLECNATKGEKPAGELLRRHYREGRLTGAELAKRLRAIEDLAAGKLRPTIALSSNPNSHKDRLPLTHTKKR